jgi:transposase InsO family protein
LFFINRLYIPDNHDLQIQILQQRHDTSLSGQLGQAKTYSRVARHCHWSDMQAFVNTYVTVRETCQRNKTPRHLPVELLQPLPIPSGPWRSISIDANVKLPDSDEYDSIMVIVCRLTKMSHFLPFREEGSTSEHLATMFNFIFRLHGIPQDIVTNRGPIFTSKFGRAFCSSVGLKLNFSTAYHPQTDGRTERVNQVLEQCLRMFVVNYEQDNWSEMVYKAEFTNNNSEHAATKMRPFFVNYGYHPLEPSCPVVPTENPSAQSRLQKLANIRETLKQNIAKAQEDYAKHSNRKVKSHLNLADEPLLKVRDKVWLDTRNIATSRPSRRLGHKLLGPFNNTERSQT